MTFSPLEEKDFSLLEKEREFFPDGYTQSMLYSGSKSGRMKGFVAKEEGKLEGFIVFSLSFEDADIDSVYVKKENRKKGLATALINLAENYIKEQKKRGIFLEVRESNFPARALYEKLGYKPISLRKKYYGEENAAVYHKEI